MGTDGTQLGHVIRTRLWSSNQEAFITCTLPGSSFQTMTMDTNFKAKHDQRNQTSRSHEAGEVAVDSFDAIFAQTDLYTTYK